MNIPRGRSRDKRFSSLAILLIIAVFLSVYYWQKSTGKPGGEPSLRFAPESERVHAVLPAKTQVLTRGNPSPDLLQKILAIYPDGVKRGSNTPPMMGGYTLIGHQLTFKPAFPLEPGLVYRAYLDLTPLLGEERSGELMTRVIEFGLPRDKNRQETAVTDIYPHVDTVPENLLKFYIHFSAPMSRGLMYEHISLRDEEGRPIPHAFLEMEHELWDAEARRLTLLMDPGRIKRGLKPNRDLGPPLRAGGKVTLWIDPSWPDQDGFPLAEPFSRSFRVTHADRDLPRITDWRMYIPPAGSNDPLRLVFREPLDHGLLQTALQVVQTGGELVVGSVTTSDGDRVWRFTPDQSWRARYYHIQIETVLEDLAGNNLKRVFDRDLLRQKEMPTTLEAITLPFKPAAQPRDQAPKAVPVNEKSPG